MTTIEAAAKYLADREHALSAAQDVASAATSEANAIAHKISANRERLDKIRDDFAVERISESHAAGLHGLLEADYHDLAKMHAAAQAKASAAAADLRAAEAEHARAVAEFERAEAGEKFAALTAHAAKLDAALCKAVAELAALRRASGQPFNSLAGIFKPSAQLAAMVQLRQIPRAQS